VLFCIVLLTVLLTSGPLPGKGELDAAWETCSALGSPALQMHLKTVNGNNAVF
jgi:hypothetical protein